MPTLFVLSGDDVGRSFEFDGPVVVGRIKEVDFTLRSVSVSRRHARLEPVQGGWDVVDLGSSNGTSLGGRRIERVRLADGDVLRLGDCEVRFRCAATTSELSAPHQDAGGGFEEELELEPDDEQGADARPETPRAAASARARPAPRAPGTTGPTRPTRSPQPSPASDGTRRVLQYKRVEQRRGVLAADLGQQPAWVRWSVYLFAVALFAALAFGAYRLTLTLRRQVAPPLEAESF